MNKKVKKIASATLVVGLTSYDLIGCANSILAYAESKESLTNHSHESIGILGTPMYKGDKVTFPNAQYENKVSGVNISIKAPVKYTLEGVDCNSKDGKIVIEKELTKEEFTKLLTSIEITLNDSTPVEVVVEISNLKNTLDLNEVEEFNGKYYKMVKASNINYEEAIKNASQMYFNGQRGYLSKIETVDESDFIKSTFNPVSIWLEGSTKFPEQPTESENENSIEGFLVEFGGQELEHVKSEVARGVVHIEEKASSEHADKNSSLKNEESGDLKSEELAEDSSNKSESLENTSKEFENEKIEGEEIISEPVLTEKDSQKINFMDSSKIVDTTKPTFEGVRGGVIKEGEYFDLTSAVTVIDEGDVDINNKLILKYIDPSGNPQSNIDTSVGGTWRVIYSATDTSGNTGEKEVSVIVETKTELILGENVVENGLMKFPNARIDFNSEETRQLRFRFKKGVGSKLRYTVDGKEIEKEITTSEVVLPAYTLNQCKEVVSSLAIEYNGTLDFVTGVVNAEYMPIGVKGPEWLLDANKNTTSGGKHFGFSEKYNFNTGVYIESLYVGFDSCNCGAWYGNNISLVNSSGKTVNVGFGGVGVKDVEPGIYTSWANSIRSEYTAQGFSINNFATRDSYNKVYKDLTAPVIKTSHEDISIEKGNSIPNITATANDDIDGNVSKDIVKVVIDPKGVEKDTIDSQVLGTWKIKYEAPDKSGNKGIKIVNIDITPDITKPVLSGIRDGVVKEGEYFDLTRAVKVTDLGDLNIQNKLMLRFFDPDGNQQNRLNDSVGGNWKVIYSATDESGNTSEKEATIFVETKTEFVLGDGVHIGKVIKFPDATINFNSNETRQLRFRFKSGVNAKIKYSIDGEEFEYSPTNKEITLPAYTLNQCKQVLKTLTLESEGTVEFITGVVNREYVPFVFSGPDWLLDIDWKTGHPAKHYSWSETVSLGEGIYVDGIYSGFDKCNCGGFYENRVSLTDLKGNQSNVDFIGEGLLESKAGVYKQWKASFRSEYTANGFSIKNFATRDSYNHYIRKNNPPSISGAEDVELVISKDKLNILENITAFDNEDRDITDRIKAKIKGTNEYITEVDISTPKEFDIVYEIVDADGNIAISEARISVFSDKITPIKLNLIKNNKTIEGRFNVTNGMKYSIYRKDLINGEYTKIKEIDEFRESSLNFIDELSKDTNAPVIEDYYIFRGKEGHTKVELDASDFENKFTYKVEGFSKKGILREKSNEPSKLGYSSGIKGFVYIVDENPDTSVLGSEINNVSGNFDLGNVADNAYLHVKAIDNEGNESNMVHIKLRDLTYNNKPRIYTSKNKVLQVGDEFNPMEGVKAYDFEDGTLTTEVTYIGDKDVDTNKIGSYQVKYEVIDSKGLVATETVTIHVVGTMELDIQSGVNEISLSWTKEPNAKSYEVYRTNADGYDFELLGEYTDTSLVDKTALDANAPAIERIYEQYLPEELSTEIVEDENKESTLVMKVKDLASTYRYFVRAIDEDGELVNSTQVSHGKSKVDLKGFSYVIDDNEDSQTQNEINASSIEDIKEAIKGNEFKFIHISAFDNNGNKSNTVHHLIGGEYETNFIPVIEGLKRYVTYVGEEIDLMEGIKAEDYEDGNITSDLKISHNIDYNKPDKYDVTYSVTDSDGNTREVKTTVRVVKEMNLEINPDFENNNMELNWDKEAIVDVPVYYEIKKYNPELENFATIGTTKETSFIDEKAKDVFGANYNSSKKIQNSDGTITVVIDAEDRGPSHKYQVFARLESDGSIIGTMNDIKSKEQRFVEGKFEGGIEGYSWHLSNNKNDIVDDVIDIYNNEITFNPEDYEWLHFAPIDKFKNKTDTVHVRLKKVNDNTAPEIKAEDRTVVVGSDFNLLDEVMAIDKEDGDLTQYIDVEGEVDTELTGIYYITYSVKDFDGVVSKKTIKVTVKDDIEKKQSLLVQSMDEGYTYVNNDYDIMKGVRVISAMNEDITDRVTYTTDLNVNIVGDYIVNYKVDDNLGNIVKFKRIVHVVPKDSKIPSKGENGDEGTSIDEVNFPYFNVPEYITIPLGGEVNPKANVIARDVEDGDLTEKIKMSGEVNSLIPGWYNARFKATDSDGNTSYATRGVEVIETNHENPDGDIPTDKPDNGENDDSDIDGNIPPKPGQPNQPDVDDEQQSGSGSGNLDNENNKNDIYEDLEINKDTDGDGNPDINIDIDGDNKPDINIDIDKDGKPDINVDIDGDGKPDVNIDTDGDGKPDLNIDVDGDGKPDYNIDTNGDGKPDTNLLEKPQAGDTIGVSAITALSSVVALVLNNKNRNKKER